MTHFIHLILGIFMLSYVFWFFISFVAMAGKDEGDFWLFLSVPFLLSVATTVAILFMKYGIYLCFN